jgi:zinc protease
MEDSDMRRNLILLAVTVVLLGAAGLEAGPKKVTLPPYEEFTLKNGLTVYVMETREVPLVTMRLLVPVGSAHDSAGKEGIAGLTAGLLLKGAAGKTAEEISETVEGMGGELEADASRDFTLMRGDFLSRDLERGLSIMADALLAPDFPAEELEREKGIVQAEIMRRRENPYYFTTTQFVQLIAEGHPYAHPVSGAAASVGAMTREDIVRFHGDQYAPQGAILAIVGDVDAEKALKLVEKEFGGWKGSVAGRSVPKLEEKRFSGRRVVVIDKKGSTQGQIRIGNIAVGRDTPQYFPITVANNILGGGFTSRLMREIRVVRGLSYGARSIAYQFKDGGLFLVVTYTKNETLREAIDVALDELTRIRDVAVAEEELESSERYISGLFPFEIETNGDLARWLTEIAFYGLEEEFVEDYRSRIDEVTSGEVQEVARSYFHADDCMIVLLADYEQVKDQLEGLGAIEVIDFEEIE